MNIRLIHELEIAIHEKIRPVHPYINTNVSIKCDERTYPAAELSIVLKLRSDEELDALIQMFNSIGDAEG